MATDRIPLAFGKSTGGAAIEIQEVPAGDQLSPIWVASVTGQNMLINGDMRINQRAFAGGALEAGVFGYDRMFADTGGCNVSVSAGGLITHNSGTWCQAIEAPRGAFGATVTVSVGDLSGGNLTVSIGGVTATIMPGSGRRYANILAPASSSTGNLLVKITGTNVTYREVMVVRGADMPNVEQRHQALEQLLSQRYYYRGQPWPEGLNFCPYTANAYFSWPLIFAVPMRATPAAAFVASGFASGGINTTFGTSGISLNASKSGARILVMSVNATTNAYFTFGNSYFTFDAEITS